MSEQKDLELAAFEAAYAEAVDSGWTSTKSLAQTIWQKARSLPVGVPGTPGARWRANGEPDPHGDRYNCERIALSMGDLTDDELADGAFMNYDRPRNIEGVLAGTHRSPLAWMTAVKDRIRWLSRKLDEALAATPAQSVGVPDGYALVPVEPTRDMLLAAGGHVTVDRYQAMLAYAPTVKTEQPDCVYCQGHGDVTRISGQTAESYSEHNEECPECKGTGLAPSLPAAGSAYGIALPSVAEFGEWIGPDGNGPDSATRGMLLALFKWTLDRVCALNASRASLSAQQSERQPELTVWEGPMPESNGKSNFTAVLMRKGANLFDGIAGGMTIARSEYPDRVRYEADCVRCLIGELDNEPCITDYDADKHSGYVAQQSAPERVSVPVEVARALLDDGRRTVTWAAQDELRALLANHAEGGKV